MSDSSPSRKIDPSIVAALIGVIGTIIVTVLTLNANKSSTPTPLPTIVVITATSAPSDTPAPTDTVPVGQPTSTPEPATNTPEPTLTFTPVPPVALGADWQQGCISTSWRPYPASIPVLDNANGCWKNPVHVFSASNGSLDFLSQRTSNGPSEIYGLFAPLPESGSVSVHVRLKDLSNVDLLMGVYADPDVVKSQGLLMTIPSGNVKKRVIAQKDNVTAYTTLLSSGNLDQGDGFWVTFTFTSNSVSSTVNPSVLVTNPVSVPSAQKWFFIGYKGSSGSYRIEGNFFGLELK